MLHFCLSNKSVYLYKYLIIIDSNTYILYMR